MRRTIRTIIVTMASLTVLAMVLIPSILADVSALSIAYGYVSVNGVGTNGIAVNLSCNGSKTINETFSTLYDVNHHAGYYQFDIANGSYYSVQATYHGVSSWANFTATGSNIERDLLISFTSTVTDSDAPPTPASTITPTPKATPTHCCQNYSHFHAYGNCRSRPLDNAYSDRRYVTGYEFRHMGIGEP